MMQRDITSIPEIPHMPALNFMKHLAPLVEQGVKTHTVRKCRKVPIEVGDRLALFTGMRSPRCRRLLETTCSRVQQIALCENGLLIIDGRALSNKMADRFARADGLESYAELRRFIAGNYGIPFDGVIIHWPAP